MAKKTGSTNAGRRTRATTPRRPPKARRSAPSGRRVAPRSQSARTSAEDESRRCLPRAASKRTTDHEEIRRWVEARGGLPSIVKRAGREGSEVLRIEFPGHSRISDAEALSWEEFFDRFDRQGLQFVYQERTRDGRESRFSKVVRAAGSTPRRAPAGLRARTEKRTATSTGRRSLVKRSTVEAQG